MANRLASGEARSPGGADAPRIALASDHALLVTFGDEISPGRTRQVRQLITLLRDRRLRGVLDVRPAYASVLVQFDPLRQRAGPMRERLAALLGHLASVPLPEPRVVELPVRYGGDLGPDLGDVARGAGLSEDEVARLHAAAEYTVCFLGFLPGFPYLSGLPAVLATPRLDTPRTRVPAGSVAIGGSQTGIYPVDSPGGWRVIGWTPLRLFDPERDPATLLRMGDEVRFVAQGLRSGRAP